jgi:hypothetical protein
MRFPLLLGLLLLFAVGGVFTGLAVSDEGEGDTDDMMQQLMALHRPGPAQAALEPLVGSWSVATKTWMGPGDPVESEGTAEHTWTMDGRVLRQSFEGTFAGMPFSGVGYLAHDNFKKEYQNVWMDSFSSGFGFHTGSANDDGTVFTLHGTWAGPMGTFDQRYVWTIVDENTLRMESFARQGEQEWKEMELTYTRR